jgi:hypothetical protein
LYEVQQASVATGYTPVNTEMVHFMVYIDAEAGAVPETCSLRHVGYFFYNTDKVTGVETGADGEQPDGEIYDEDADEGSLVPPVDGGDADDLELGPPTSSYVIPLDGDNTDDHSSTDHVFTVLNARSTSDMPFTGGQILGYLAVAGVVGVVGVVSTVLAVRRGVRGRGRGAAA